MHKDLLKLYVGEELEPAKSYYDYALPHVRDASTTDEVERFVVALLNLRGWFLTARVKADWRRLGSSLRKISGVI